MTDDRSVPPFSLRDGFVVGESRVHPSLNRIDGPAGSIRVEPKVMDVLVHLAEHAGRLVRREDLVSAVWGEAGATDDVVSRSVSELRKAFGDDARRSRIIETIRKAGYRLVPGVRPPSPPAAINERSVFRPAALALGVVVLAGGALAIASEADPTDAVSLALGPSIRPVASIPGVEVQPALTPDGARLAFARRHDDGAYDLWSVSVDAPVPVRITDTPGVTELSPSWSPDGRYLVFVRRSERQCAVVARDMASTKERRLLACDDHGDGFVRVTWSPAGNRLYAVAKPDPGLPYAVVSIGVDGKDPLGGAVGPPIPATSPPAGSVGDMVVAVAPGGQRFVVLRVHTEAVADLYVVDSRTGETTRLTEGAGVFGVTWPREHTIWFSSNREDRHAIWSIDPDGGVPQFVTATASPAREFASDTGGTRLIFRDDRYDVDIEAYPVDDWGSASRIARSTRAESKPRLSPDGRRLAYESNRDGFYEVWLHDLTTGEDRRLTTLRGSYNGSARWSPDGRAIAFDGRPEGRADIYVYDVDRGEQRRITDHHAQDAVPSWSHDGRFVFFASDRGGDWQIWRVALEGGEPVPVTRAGGYASMASPDGRYLYYAHPTHDGIWRVPTHGGDEVRLLAQPASPDFDAWDLVGGNLYYLERAPAHNRVMVYDPVANTHRSLGTVGEVPPLSGGLDVAPDGSMVFVSILQSNDTELAVVERLPRP